MNSKKNRMPSALPTRPTREQVEALAHAIWLDRGRPVGRELEHWLEAERQLGAGSRLQAEGGLDPDTAGAAQIERELGQIVDPPETRSPTAL
jgi:hypothetical protein